eukprot:TRINITY_DN1469_c0_g2_i1.p1 TRINITY_DN1469_c0_g2~~TRINITY_DN1469_c0_g2_i1.p1  ORF type:complete len:224 (-),score=20.11 TRINITY_DN1469_c0_g2_i1:141-812(-)
MNQEEYPSWIFLINPVKGQQTNLYRRINDGDEYYTHCPFYLCIEPNQTSTLSLSHEGSKGKYQIKITCQIKQDTLYQFEESWDTSKTKTHSLLLQRLPEANNSSLWTLECFYLNFRLFSVNFGGVGQKQAKKISHYLPLPERTELFPSIDTLFKDQASQDFIHDNPHPEDIDRYLDLGTCEIIFDTEEASCQEDDLDIESLLANIQTTTNDINPCSPEIPEFF